MKLFSFLFSFVAADDAGQHTQTIPPFPLLSPLPYPWLAPEATPTRRTLPPTPATRQRRPTARQGRHHTHQFTTFTS